MVLVQSLKSITHVERSNRSGYPSLPSGHTAEVFQLAAILDMEYQDVSPWISVCGYAVAAATGTLRMLNNKHWISDVLVGAGIGIFCT
jgi:membrane-associated phospholipid phosphatase